MLSSFLSLAALPLVVKAFDLIDDNSMVQETGLLRFPLRVSEGAPIVRNITKRQNDVALESQMTGFFYSIDLTLGTPGQVVSVNFDTGSSELWVNPTCSKAQHPEFCESFGRFTESSTFVDLNTQGQVTYGTGYVNFEYGYDYVSVGSARISQQVFGVGYDSEFSSTGIMGAGPDLSGWNSPYPLIIDSLAEQGYTNSRAFSLDIRSLGSDRGSVVFGGIDTKKYSGALEKRPIVPAANSPDGYTRYWVNLDGITVVQEDGTEVEIFNEVNGLTVLLDSGYTISALPGPLFNAVVEAFPSAQPSSPGATQWVVDCAVADTDGTVDFKFGETVVKVPYNDFVWHQPDAGICVLGVFQDDEFPVLGDTFLRAAYVVYDWDNQNIHIANNEDCGSNLVAIGTGPDAVPSLVGECGGSEPTESATSSTAAPTSTSTVSEPDNTSTASETVTSSPETSTTAAPSSSESESSFSTTSRSSGWHNTTTSAVPTLTSTFTTSKTYTITKCPPTVTSCPIGSVTTEIVTSYTTYCPTTTTKAPHPSVTSVITSTKTYTITDCPGNSPCTKGEVKTEVITHTTSYCPETSATYTIPHTYTCGKSQPSCPEGVTKTTIDVVTVVPVTTKPHPTVVPGQTTYAPPPANGTFTTLPPPPGVPTETVPAVVPTAGATEMFHAPGFVVLAAGVLAAAALV